MRCPWVSDDPLYIAYHDHEWGVPLYEDRPLFELFSLETQVAGLSWLIVLKRREGYRQAFEGFDIDRVAQMNEADIDRIAQRPDVIRSRPKIAAIVHNARLCQNLIAEYGSLHHYFWSYVDHTPLPYARARTSCAISEILTHDLKQRGFRFVGSLTIYAFMQACGMINDHTPECLCHGERHIP